MRTAIIGGGIAGLAAAYELEKARASGSPVEYTLFEARDTLGGVLSSEIVDGVVLERGPDSFLTEKPAAAELCRELGLGAESPYLRDHFGVCCRWRHCDIIGIVFVGRRLHAVRFSCAACRVRTFITLQCRTCKRIFRIKWILRR